MPMDCSSCNCLCRNGNVRWIIFRCLRFCSLATKSPLYITCNRNSVESSNEILKKENHALYFSASFLLLFVVFQFGKNCVKTTFQRKYKNFELYLFLLFGTCRSGFLEDGPAFSMSTSFLYFFLWQIKNCYHNMERYRVRTLLTRNEWTLLLTREWNAWVVDGLTDGLRN